MFYIKNYGTNELEGFNYLGDLIDEYLDSSYEIDYVNELYSPVEIGSLIYDAGLVLQRTDPIALRQIRLDLIDNIEKDYLNSIDEETESFYCSEIDAIIYTRGDIDNEEE